MAICLWPTTWPLERDGSQTFAWRTQRTCSCARRSRGKTGAKTGAKIGAFDSNCPAQRSRRCSQLASSFAKLADLKIVLLVRCLFWVFLIGLQLLPNAAQLHEVQCGHRTKDRSKHNHHNNVHRAGSSRFTRGV